MKTVPMEMIRQRVLRTGDGTHKYNKMNKDAEGVEGALDNNNTPERDVEHFWGWGKFTKSSFKRSNLTFFSSFKKATKK